MKHIIFSILALSLMANVGQARENQDETRVELEVNYWMVNLDSTARVTQDGAGTTFNMKEDLGMSDAAVPEIRFTVNTGPRSALFIQGVGFSYDGDNRLNKAISFEGVNYSAGTRVVSDLALNYYRLGWRWLFISDRQNQFQVGSLVELKVISIAAKMAAPDLFQKGEGSMTTYFPALGLSFRIKAAPMFHFFGEVSGITMGQYGYFMDAEFGLRLIPIKYVEIIGGYRLFTVEAAEDPDFFKFNMSGPFVGVGARF